MLLWYFKNVIACNIQFSYFFCSPKIGIVYLLIQLLLVRLTDFPIMKLALNLCLSTEGYAKESRRKYDYLR